MSWNFSVRDIPRDEVGEQLRVAKTNYFGTESWRNSEVIAESSNDADLAIEAAVLLVRGGQSAGVVGTDGNVDVDLSGHANPDHGKRDGWATETVGVRVTEK